MTLADRVDSKLDSEIRLVYHLIASTSELHDDGMSHYVNIMTNDSYSYDMFKDKWIEKNAKKETVVKRLPKCNVTNMLFDCSTVPKEQRHIWGLD